MNYNILWFILIAVLWIGFFFLEGFDFGVGMLLPFLGKKDEERRAILNTIGPHWDGNEVWLLTAGGATFAAFPHWYATMFSGFYLPLFLLLVGLILRGISFEYRSKDPNPAWRNRFDWMIAIGSFLPSLLLGTASALVFHREFPFRGVLRDHDILVVDEVWETGETMAAVFERIRAAGGRPMSAVIHYKPGRSRVALQPDHYAELAHGWVTYPYKVGD